MHPMRSLILLTEHSLPENTFRKAAQILTQNIDWSGGGETVCLMLRDYDRSVTEEDCDKGNRKFSRALKSWALDRVRDAFNEIDWRLRDGTITVWREITAPPDWKPSDKHLGIYWSWDKEAAEAHWGSFQNGHVKWLLTAEVSANAINWPATLAANGNPGYEEEKEIQLSHDEPIKLLKVERR